MGFKYKLKSVLKRKGLKSLKLLFIIVLCAFIYGLIFCINESYIKFNTKPEILVSEKFINRHDIPFPAITICPPQVVKSEFLNMTKINNEISQRITPKIEDLAILAASGYACSSNKALIEKLHLSGNKDYNEDVVSIIREMSPQMNDVFDQCQILIGNICSQLFVNTLTYRGSCFTFNMLEQKLIFKNETSKDFLGKESVPSLKQKPMWTLEQRYLTRDYVMPFRSTDVGSLVVRMKLNKNESSNLCPERLRGHSVTFHLPNEHPSFMHTFTNFEVKKKKFISIKATASKIDDYLRKFPLDQRGCYNEDERQLRFFKQYTMINCLEECIANFTFQKCGCVAYYAPRSDDLRICRFIDRNCFKKVYYYWPTAYYEVSENMRDNSDLPCNCMPTCSNIQFSEVNDFTFDSDALESEDFLYSDISIYFNYGEIVETTKRATYHFHNFIAEVGGLLSLFLGFSLLSILELSFGCLASTRAAIRYIFSMISWKWSSSHVENLVNNNIIIVIPYDEQTATVSSDQQISRTEGLEIEDIDT